MSDWTAFDFALDTRIRFGVGVRSEVGTGAAAYGRRVALITGRRSFDDHAEARDIADGLRASGAEIVERLPHSGEPDDDAVVATAGRLAELRVDVIVAIGGGSALDLAKAAGAVAGGLDLEAALAGSQLAEPLGPPVVAVPTTAGTGSEVSRAAIVLHRSARRKRGVRGRGIAPRAAYVDPALTVSAGGTVTAESGFDAMAHAIETAASRAASPLNRLLAAEAFQRLLGAVPRARAVPDDLEARTSASYAALLMGINLATASTCLPHRLQYPVGAATGTSHARGVAALLPAWMARLCGAAPEPLAELARGAGIARPGEADAAAARRLVDRVVDWMDEIGMGTRLADLGVAESDLDGLAAAVEGALHNDPGPTDPAAIRSLYEQSL